MTHPEAPCKGILGIRADGMPVSGHPAPAEVGTGDREGPPAWKNRGETRPAEAFYGLSGGPGSFFGELTSRIWEGRKGLSVLSGPPPGRPFGEFFERRGPSRMSVIRR